MYHNGIATKPSDLKESVRPAYYHGMMVTEYTFRQLTDYMNQKRWLLNRLVTGHGVICGLDVIKGKGQSICVTAGVAIDKGGREIIVPDISQPVPIPQDMLPIVDDEDCDDDEKPEEAFLHVVLCYQECLDDPAPVLAGDCNTEPDCRPGAVRERYRIEFREGKAERPSLEIGEIMPDVIRHNRLNYDQLALWVTEGCPQLPEETCIPLANICFTDEENEYEMADDGIDVTIRPIVYGNDVLFQILLSMLADNPRHRRK